MSDKLETEMTLDTDGVVTSLKTVASAIGGLTNDFRAFSGAAESANKAVSKGLKEVSESVKTVSLATVKTEFEKLEKTAGSYFKQAISKASDFEEGLRKVNTIAKLSESDLDALGNRVTSLNSALGTSIPATKAIAGELEVMRAGFKGASESTIILGQSMLLAFGDADQFEGSVKTLLGALKSYGAGADEAGHFTDVLVKASQVGAGDVSELGGAIGKVGTVAAASGIPIEQVAAAIATLNKQNIAPTQSAVSIVQILESLEKKSPKASAALRELGVVTDAQNLKNKGLQATIEEIVRATDGRIDKEEKLIEIFGKKNLKAAIGLADGGGAQDLAAVNNASLAAAEQQKELTKGLAYQSEKLKASIGGVAREIGEVLAPGAKKFVAVAREMVSVIADIPPGVLAVGVGAASLVSTIASVAATIAGLGILLPTLGRGFSSAITYMNTYGVAAKTAAAAVVETGVAAGAAAEGVAAAGTAGTAAAGGMGLFLSQVVLGPALLVAFAAAVASTWHEIANLGREQTNYVNLSRGQRPDGSKVFKGPTTNNTLSDLLLGVFGGSNKAPATTTDFNNQLLAQDAVLEQAKQAKAAALESNKRISERGGQAADPYTLAGQTLKNVKRRLTSGLAEAYLLTGVSDGSIPSVTNQEDQEEKEILDPKGQSRKNEETIKNSDKAIAEAEARKKRLKENRDLNRAINLSFGKNTGSIKDLTEEQVLQFKADKKDEFKDRRADILNTDDEDLPLKEKAAALRKLFAEINAIKVNGEPIKLFDAKEIREVEKSIAQIENRAKKQARNEGAARSRETFAEELDQIKLGKAGIEQATDGFAVDSYPKGGKKASGGVTTLEQRKAQLQALYTRTEDQRDSQPDTTFGRQQRIAIEKELRVIEDEFGKTQKKIDEDHRKAVIETAKIRLESQQAVLKGLLVEQAELERLEQRGASNLKERQDNLDKQAQARANEQRQKSNIELKQAEKIDDPADRTAAINAIKKKDAQAQQEIDQDTARKKTRNSDAQKVEDISRIQETLSAEERLRAFRVKDYQEQAAAGKDVSQKLIDAIKEREKVQEKQIQAQKDAATVGLDANTQFGADKIAAAERDAAIQTLEARKAARKEIEAITGELEKQRGFETHLGEISSDAGGLNFDDITKKMKAYRSGAGGGGLDGVNPNEKGGIEGLANPFGGLDTAGIERSLLQDKTKGNATGANLRRAGEGAPGGFGSGRAGGPAEIKVGTALTITLLDNTGKSIPAKINQVTSSGRGSTTARMAERIGGFSSLGGQ